MRSVAALALAATTALLISGCSSSPLGPDEENAPQYLDPTSPENVLSNLIIAYEAADLEGYARLFSADFVFYTNLNDQNPGNEDPLPVYWGWEIEEECHSNMFGWEHLEEIDLDLTTIEVDSVEVPDGSGGMEMRYSYYQGVRLWLEDEGNMAYLATLPSLFYFRRADSRTAPAGASVWEIVEWHDNPYNVEPDPLDGRASECSWSGIKAMFLVTLD